MPPSSVMHLPVDSSGSWVFDESVAACFDDMLDRSVPLYQQAQELMVYLSNSVLVEGDTVLDLGVSTARTFQLLDAMLKVPVQYVGVDPSQAMLDKAHGNFPAATYYEMDALGFLSAIDCNPKVVLLSLTLQFVPIEHRQRLLAGIYTKMVEGGLLLVFEKCLGETGREESFFTETYLAFKKRNGYGDDALHVKRNALANVLVPVPATQNERFMADAGFFPVRLLSWCQFVLWGAYK